jgi:hypothetical protein
MAALRAMQQVQHHVASQTETSNGAASVVNQLAAIAKERDVQFQLEQEQRKLRQEEERRMNNIKREEDLFGEDEYDLPSGSKRRLSQVDSPEGSMRPAPTFVVPAQHVFRS